MNLLDGRLFLWLNLSHHDPAWLVDMARFGTTVWPTAVLLTVLSAFVIGPGRWRRAALHMLLAMLLAWRIGQLEDSATFSTLREQVAQDLATIKILDEES